MATMASALRDIAITSSGRDNLTAVAAMRVPVTKTHSESLPTPPNSISPALPPLGLCAQMQKAALEPIDSDLDLHDEPSTPGSLSQDAAGAINPLILAKLHPPEALLDHGPLAIRHIMDYLTTSVPGFTNMPPAKARRLVVGALEGRGPGCEGGGLHGDVEFEKIGWGRWDVRRRGQPPRTSSARSRLSPLWCSSGIPISRPGRQSADRSKLTASGSSVGDQYSAAYSHDDHDLDMMDSEADKMSMDGSASASCSEAPDDDAVMNDDPEDVTDDEDWAAVGAAALRASSYQASSGHLNNSVYTAERGGLRYLSTNSGMARAPQPSNRDCLATVFGAASHAQEREAAEALLRLGSL